jgi:hypothetical protein
MATTGCTNDNYTVNLVGYVPGTGSTDGTIVTFKTPKPVWSEGGLTGPSNMAVQCSAVAIGGFNGLNS